MDAVTFQSEVLKIERLLYHVAYTALGNRQECADAVQEALLRAWKKRGSLRSQDHFKAWMVRILLNTIADGKRRGKLPTTELSDTLPAEERPDNLPLYEALRALLCEELEAASYPVVLVYLDGCTMRECAKMLRVPEGTVKSRLSRAKALLRDYLSEEA